MAPVTTARLADDPYVREIVLARPESLNALSSDMCRAIAAAASETAVDPLVRAVVLRSSVDRAFGAGADLAERLGAPPEVLFTIREQSRRATRALLEIPVPVVAAVQGYALGGGLELALTADVVVADETAVLGLPETSIGIIPGGGGTTLLTQRIGCGAASDLVYTGRRVSPAEALKLRLVDRVVPAGEATAAALGLAREIATRSPEALRHAKASLSGSRGLALAEALDLEDRHWRAAVVSADYQEGLQAFAERRRPVWGAPARRRASATPHPEP